MDEITLPLSELLNAYVGVEALAKLKLPPKASIHVARVLVELDRERRVFEKERLKLIQDKGQRDLESPSRWHIPDGDVKARDQFLEAVGEMTSVEVTIRIAKLTEDDLVDIEPHHVAAMLPLMETSPRDNRRRRK